MGGARCSYRNCTQKSDQVTHMFHFPVFDKVRCHQWITNAQKQDYFNLKLSQLKNRVICQHHFTDDCFMNDLVCIYKYGRFSVSDIKMPQPFSGKVLLLYFNLKIKCPT